MREAKGVTLTELAARIGITRGNIARLESQKNATLRTLERYTGGLGCVMEIGFTSAEVKRRKKASAAGERAGKKMSILKSR
jgi:transcriptional regulator with XRE-family HTH domain